MSPPFPEVVNDSLIQSFRSCEQQAFQTYFEHWKPSEESVHLVAGKAFASGLEVARRAFYINGFGAEEALGLGLAALWAEYGTFAPPEDSPKGPIRMAGALEYYFSQYPLGADGATPHRFGTDHHGIEFSFLEPLNTLHPVTGDPLLYSGRADMVADAFGGLFLYDEKTTSALGPTWAKKWEHRSQFTSYCWGLRAHGFHPTGIVVRGVAILKDSYSTAQAITYRSDWEVDRWLSGVNHTLRRMVEAWQKGDWQYNLGNSCTAYSGCPFTRICKSPEPEKWLSLYFHRRRYDPVTRIETPLLPLESPS
jgi:hypothetical protein